MARGKNEGATTVRQNAVVITAFYRPYDCNDVASNVGNKRVLKMTKFEEALV